LPNIPGLPVILALLFAPQAQIRRNADKSRYESILTGLGYDRLNERPYYEERDASLIVDVSLSVEDILKINNLRLNMSTLLHTTRAEKLPNVNDHHRANILKDIQKDFISLIKEKRTVCDVRYPKDPYKWDFDQEDALEYTNVLGERAIFQFVKIPPLVAITRENLEKMRHYANSLEKGTSMSLYRECRLCGKAIQSESDLKLHLLSKIHQNRKKELGF
jgi:hypothetical protein